jgi:hypothetical protein
MCIRDRAWTIWQPSAPSNLNGTLVPGGTLLPNTTYYFRVYVWDYGNTTTVRNSLNQSSKQIYSPYSATFSITTDTVNKSVALTWNKVYKRNGVTEVDGYEIIMNTSDSFDTDIDGLARYPSPVGYYNPATATNAYTVTAPPGATNYQKNIRFGIPLCISDGLSTCTFASLYSALIAGGYTNHTSVITSFDGQTVLGYRFLATIEITKYSGESTSGVYSITSTDEIIIVYGSLSVYAMKWKLINSIFIMHGSTHGGGYYFFQTPTAGSIQTGCLFRYNMLDQGKGGKSWGGIIGNAPYSSPNLRSVCNMYMNWTQGGYDGLIEPTTILAPSSVTSMPHAIGALLGRYFNIALTGKMEKVIMYGRYGWPTNNVLGFGMDMTNNDREFLQMGVSNWCDCIWRWRGYTGISDSDGWNPRIECNTYYAPHWKNTTFYIAKTIFVTVKDSNGVAIQNAQVVFKSSSGINLTRGNTLADVCDWEGSELNAGNNFDATETTITHDQVEIWLRTGAWEGTHANPIAGETYWLGTEKITIQSISPTPVAWQSNAYSHIVTRGVEGTQKSWALNKNTSSVAEKLITAPNYHLTNASGQTFNMTMFRVYKTTDLNSRTKFLTEWVSNGWMVESNYAPVEVTISYPGKQSATVKISDTYAIGLGTDPIVLEVILEDEVGKGISRSRILGGR